MGWKNVWMGITCENQEMYDQRWPILQDIPAYRRFISYEPAVGPLQIMGYDFMPDWIICGGESGPNARIIDPVWAKNLVGRCLTNRVPLFFKQWGTYQSNPLVQDNRMSIAEAQEIDPPSNGKGGALLHNRLWREFPAT